MDRVFGPVQIFDKGLNTAFVVKIVTLVGPLIEDMDLYPGVEKRKFTQTLRQRLE